ncbi:MAG: RluA family pseudouridine synthase [Bacteroidales bacterium]|jgi:23S rRNA pseudouridine1911/1915/1917 synthase|nr:RluA family pseudouridine synthase [Bacteroidales bacterium]MDD4001874.1 RluA family pseudouridine synthase [Bacteroidales bacterium]MDD4528449.1 RluA family pseudouridine synthase [Bacteroidales bacterium]
MEGFDKQIIFEDNHILVINKKNSQIVHGDKTGDDSLVDYIKDYLREKYNKPGNIYCGVVHRLDRPVSGVVVFTKTEKALVRLNKQIHDKLFTKKYWAIVRNAPPKPEEHLIDYLIKNESQNKSYITKDKEKGLLAELKYKLLCQSEYYNLLEIELFTGRHHQIRVQLANIGCPIKGDLKYGFGRSNKISSISLHARELSFEHPTIKQKMKFIAPVPQEPLWQWFEENVK